MSDIVERRFETDIHTNIHTCCNEYCKIVKPSYLEQSKKCKACSITAVMEQAINYTKNT